MYFPKYWSTATFSTSDSGGCGVERTCWGWSDASVTDAKTKAEARAERAARYQSERNAQSHVATRALSYGLYDNAPLREEILQ